ncbi:hypothetical protein K3495_g11905 [Podosphaera aphanis]|nr:hypothetical protein K3495_g11905 [Podosphaera aphanis]
MAFFKISGGILAPLCIRILKSAIEKTNKLMKLKIPGVANPHRYKHSLRLPSQKHACNLGALHQSRKRWYVNRINGLNNSASRFFAGHWDSHLACGNRYHNTNSTTAKIASQMNKEAPFAWTLRPNLTGGTLLRTSGGYSLGGGQASGIRYFSHVPTAPTQVFQNVSAATRAFGLSGQKAQFNGLTTLGEKSYRHSSYTDKKITHDIIFATNSKINSYIDFAINPMITALTPHLDMASSRSNRDYSLHLNSEDLLENLHADFTLISKDLSIVLSDLKKLSSLGDLSITIEESSTLRVHFPGYDRDSLERLCDDLCVQRGIIHEIMESRIIDCNTALQFPFAPTSNQNSAQSTYDYEDSDDELKGYTSFRDYETITDVESRSLMAKLRDPSDYDGIEGICQFLKETDDLIRP